MIKQREGGCDCDFCKGYNQALKDIISGQNKLLVVMELMPSKEGIIDVGYRKAVEDSISALEELLVWTGPDQEEFDA